MSLFQRWMLLCSGIACLVTLPLRAEQMRQVNPGVARETAECFAGPGQKIDCFARTFGNGLSAVQADSASWNLPRNLGGNLAAAPSCVAGAEGSISCFAATDSGVLATITLEGSTWGRWSSLGGTLAPSRVSCVTSGQQRISCHARGAGGQFLERTRGTDGAWGKWQSYGAVFTADPACLAMPDGRDACFGRGAQGEFVALVQDGHPSRRQEIRIRGDIEGRPSCIAEAGSTVTCVMMQSSGGFAIWRGQVSAGNTSGELKRVEVSATGEPSCFERASGLACGWRNEKSELSVAQIAADGSHADIQVPPTGRITGVKCLTLSSGTSACVVTGTNKSLRYVGLAQAARQQVPEPPKEKAAPAIAQAAQRTTQSTDTLEGAWRLSDVSSSMACLVVLQPAEGAGPGALRLGPACHGMALPQGLTTWKRDLGSLRFSGADKGHALHFSPMGGGRWMSPTQGSAVILSRPVAQRTAVAPQGRPGLRMLQSMRRDRWRARH